MVLTLPYREDLFVEADDFAKAINVALQSEEGRAMRERMKVYKSSIGADLLPGGSSYAGVMQFTNFIRGGSLST